MNDIATLQSMLHRTLVSHKELYDETQRQAEEIEALRALLSDQSRMLRQALADLNRTKRESSAIDIRQNGI